MGRRAPNTQFRVREQVTLIPTGAFADYVQRDQTRREHAADLHAFLGLRSFRLSHWRDCLQVSADAAWEHIVLTGNYKSNTANPPHSITAAQSRSRGVHPARRFAYSFEQSVG